MGKIETDHTGSGGGITLSSDGTSLLLDGTAIGGGGGAYELVAHTSVATEAASVEFASLNDDYISYKLVMNWVLDSQQSSYPNIRFLEGTTVLTGYGIARYAGQNQSNTTAQSDIPIVYETSSLYFNSIIDIWGIGLTNSPLQLSGQSFSSTSANQIVTVGAWKAAAAGVTPDKIQIRASWSSIPVGAKLTLYGLKSA